MPCAYRGFFFLIYILFAGKLVILYDLLLQLELVDEIQHTKKKHFLWYHATGAATLFSG